MPVKGFVEINCEEAEKLIEESKGVIGNLEKNMDIIKLSNHLEDCEKCLKQMTELKKSRHK
ncbi:MAG: hypothetical protein KAS78_04065 [Candidatus Pacebacteria bacterium]|nr:hypothetical protein [Candidatus Andersenbacteria bacterium]MCK4891817.1 hypothetical protein [Candidatus Paceibacterota bacterium]